MEKKTGKTALVLGAGGLVGGHCVDYLLDDPYFQEVTVLVRRNLPIEHPKLKQHTVDFEKLASFDSLFNVDAVFSCLGIKGPATSYEFEQVEFGYPSQAASIAASKGVDQYLVVTAMMSNPRSKMSLFRYKGMLEEAVKKEPLNALHIFRPSLIVGERKEARPDEEFLAKLFKGMTFLVRPLRKYLYVDGKFIAFSMVQMAKAGKKGLHTYNSNKIHAIYNSGGKA